jgi:hypothetical protein
MARQLRTLQQGEIRRAFPAASTGLTVVNLPAAGFSFLTRGSNYVLGRPEEGVRKILVNNGTASTATIVYASTDAAATVKFDKSNTVITFSTSTVDQIVELMGVNSTQWVVTNVHPYTTVADSPSFGTS